MTLGTYSRTFHPNWVGIVGTAAVVMVIVAAVIVAWRRRGVRS